MIENSIKTPTFEEESTPMEHQDNLIGVLRTLYKWRKPVGYVCLIAAIGSAILAVLFLDNYYQSTTTFYPASSDLAKPKRIFGLATQDVSYYGGEEELDRLITIAKSSEMKTFLIDSFNLYQHYDIIPGKEKSKEKISKKLSGLYDVQKTKYEAIELSIEDTDKEMAHTMVNAARNKLNTIGQEIIKINQARVLSLIEQNMIDKKRELVVLSDSLIEARKKYGIYNIETQSELLTTMIAEAEGELSQKATAMEILRRAPNVSRDTIVFLEADVSGLEKQIQNLTTSESSSIFNLKRFNDGIGEVEILSQMLLQSKKQYGYDQQRLTQFKAAYNSEVPALIIIEKGQVPISKSRPKRSLIVIAATLIAFIGSLLTILVLEAYKDINWKDITNAG